MKLLLGIPLLWENTSDFSAFAIWLASKWNKLIRKRRKWSKTLMQISLDAIVGWKIWKIYGNILQFNLKCQRHKIVICLRRRKEKFINIIFREQTIHMFTVQFMRWKVRTLWNLFDIESHSPQLHPNHKYAASEGITRWCPYKSFAADWN